MSLLACIAARAHEGFQLFPAPLVIQQRAPEEDVKGRQEADVCQRSTQPVPLPAEWATVV